MKLVDFRIPTRLDEARSLLKELGPSALPLAGATSLVFAPGKDPKTAVDITRLGLDGIRRDNGTFIVGSTTRLAALQKHHADGWVLDRVAERLASQQIRNMSTLGGNIARVFPWADFPIVLLALGAEMVIAGDAERIVGADDFFSSQPARFFKGGELLTAVRVPVLGAGCGFGYRKQTQSSFGFSLMTVAAWIERDGAKVRRARVAAGAGIPFPARLGAIEQAVTGQDAGEALFADAAAKGLSGVKFKSAAGMSEEYIAHLASVLVRDALTEAWENARA